MCLKVRGSLELNTVRWLKLHPEDSSSAAVSALLESSEIHRSEGRLSDTAALNRQHSSTHKPIHSEIDILVLQWRLGCLYRWQQAVSLA